MLARVPHPDVGLAVERVNKSIPSKECDVTQPQAPGTPIWVDLSSPDVSAAAEFYNKLFGWTSEDMGEEAGHYTMFSSGDKVVAAVGPQQAPGGPPYWTTYVGTNDAEDAARKVTENGGTVLMAPFDVMGQGKMGVFTDPSGGAFAVWQPGQMPGAGQFNTPVSLAWNELHTRDVDGAKNFYPKVFGWGVHANDMGEGQGEYVEWQVGGKSIAGAVGMSMEPQGTPTYWLVYFAVADTDDIVKRAGELGGKVISPPMDIPQGRFAIIADPQGAVFGVIKL
jgi:predicted enzyme related to lactoylglutathione lyase